MNMRPKKGQKSRQIHRIDRVLFWCVSVFITLYLISLFTPFISNYTQYPLQIIRCTRLPILAHAGKNYLVPESRVYRVTGLEEAYFCTELEAQTAGYHKSPLND